MRRILCTYCLLTALLVGACTLSPGQDVTIGEQPGDLGDSEVGGDAVCTPACAGIECGADGCGGNCGDCPEGLACTAAGKCTAGPCTPGEPCDDGDPCTEADSCADGVCAGKPYACDDDKECTEDECDGTGECLYTISAGACLINGICYLEGQTHAKNSCKECLTAVSNSAWTNDDTNECDDGDACVTGEYCDDGECVGGEDPLECDDDNACTEDSCDAEEGCGYEILAGDCDDGDACTVLDECAEGECIGKHLDCEDDNACTADSCDPGEGCQYDAQPGDCDDGDLCTMGDFCMGGECKPGGTPLNCDDGNDCTDDSCDSQAGCTYANSNAWCDDEDKCTVGDYCQEGQCYQGPGSLNCDDGNPCTTDSCVPAIGCVNAAAPGQCDDGSVCTIGDFCQDGVCMPGPDPLDCDDNDPCTVDSCVAATGCHFAPATGIGCDDGNGCTDSDTCTAGVCGGVVKVCDDANVCTSDGCNPLVAGGCVFTPNALVCDDGNDCTADSCDPQQGCKYLNAVGFCDDGNPCTQGDFCANGTCVAGGNICPCSSDLECAQFEDGDLCNGLLYCNKSSPSPSAWACALLPGSVVVCNPGLNTACSVQTCVPSTGQCIATAINEGAPCDDGSVCTLQEKCNNGACTGSENLNCNDGNACTADTCHALQGCLHAMVQNGTSCGGAGWTCQAGQCVSCTPSCLGKNCGPDGCGGSCGSCAQNEYCNGVGQCLSLCPDCQPWQECVGGQCTEPSTGIACPSGGEKVADQCYGMDWKGCCVGEGSDELYYCGSWGQCPFNEPSCLCYSPCGANELCGWSDQYQYFGCGQYGAAPAPSGEYACEWYCQANCAGKSCGPDGCGGTCGNCNDNQYCSDWGACVDQGLSQCLGSDTPSHPTCNGITFAGCCDYKGRVLYCQNGSLYCIDCSSIPSCGWDAQDGFYDCSTGGGTDPSGVNPKSCTKCAPSCPWGFSCVNGMCVD